MIPNFRAWDKDNKYMEYTDKNLVVCFSDEGVEVTDHTTFSHSCTSMESFELMQSTGLKDKNGTEIYEGDIVKNIYDEIYTVKWFDAAFYLEEKYNGGFDYHELHFEDNKKVIGNIYENPELLEDE